METHPCNFPQVCPQVGRKGPGCCGSLSPALNPHNPQPRLRRRPHAVDSRLSSRTRTPRTRHDMTSVTPRPPTARPRHRLQAMSPASSHLIVTFCPHLRNCPGLQLVADSPGGPVRAPGALVAAPKPATTPTARPRPWDPVGKCLDRPPKSRPRPRPWGRRAARPGYHHGRGTPTAILRSQGLPPSPNSLVDLNALAGVGGDVVRGAGPLVDLSAYVVRMHTLPGQPSPGFRRPLPGPGTGPGTPRPHPATTHLTARTRARAAPGHV